MGRAKPIIIALALALVATLAGAADCPEPPGAELTARIIVKSKLPLETNELKWELVLTNRSKKPVRVCTLCGGMAGGGKEDYKQTFAPDWWKSDRPRDSEFDKHIVTLKPGQSVSLPSGWGGFRGEKYTIKASYRVGKAFAGRHKVWAGEVKAGPVVIRTLKPKKD
jgi:hypothetical protein